MPVTPPVVNVAEVVSSTATNSTLKTRVDNVIKKACSEITTTVCHKTADQLFERLSALKVGEVKFFGISNIYEIHRGFSIFKNNNQLFECALINKFPGTDRRPNLVHHFLVVKVGYSWRFCQSMANRYTLNDFVSNRWDYISNLILSSKETELRNNSQVCDMEKSWCPVFALRFQWMWNYFKNNESDSDLNGAVRVGGQRDTFDGKRERALRAQCDVMKMISHREWLDSPYFVKTVLSLVIKCLKNEDDDCFFKLFGVDREDLKIEARGRLILSVKSVQILG